MFGAAHASKALDALRFPRLGESPDKINHDMLLAALTRFGIPQQMVDMIGSIYTGLQIILLVSAGKSSQRCQASGIAQGCPLSPYLFITMQSVMFLDVDRAVEGVHADVVEPDL